MFKNLNPLSKTTWPLWFIGLYLFYYLGYEIDRSNFYLLISCFGVCFAAYFVLIKQATSNNFSLFLAAAIGLRLLLFFATPTLSDDYFRFIWDGQLLANGVNPFDFLPTEVTIDFPNKAELLAGMNSSEYYTVYPPIAQVVYFLGAWLSPNSILGSIILMRCVILLAEIGVILLLPKLLSLLKMNPLNSLWYCLNPLVIIELTGNLHFEGIVIFFFLLATYLLVLQKQTLSAIAWAFAAATKLIPIFFLPIILRKLSFKKAALFYLTFGIVFLALWLPLHNSTLIPHFLESIQLYSKTFEFNASVYYVIRAIGFEQVGWNVIQTAGPWLTRIAYIGMAIVLLRKKIISWTSFFGLLLFALSWYYLLALIVHPWYSITLVFLAVFTRFRYPMVWSAMAVLSYYAYSNPAFQESLWLVGLEYLMVFGVVVWELSRNKNSATFI